MKLAFLLPVLGLIAAGAVHFNITGSNTESNLTPNNTPVTEPAEVVAAQRIHTSTPTVYQGEMVRLELEAPNPAFLGVIDPDGKFFYVVYDEKEAPAGLQPFVNSDDFVYMRQMHINTGKFKADPYTYGVEENQPVFTKSGMYTFIMGDNLHVDDPGLVFKTTITYRHVPRTAGNIVAAR